MWCRTYGMYGVCFQVASSPLAQWLCVPSSLITLQPTASLNTNDTCSLYGFLRAKYMRGPRTKYEHTVLWYSCSKLPMASFRKLYGFI